MRPPRNVRFFKIKILDNQTEGVKEVNLFLINEMHREQDPPPVLNCETLNMRAAPVWVTGWKIFSELFILFYTAMV